MLGVLLALLAPTVACVFLPRVTWLRGLTVGWTLLVTFWLLHALGHIGRNVARPDPATMNSVVTYRAAWTAAIDSSNAFTKPYVVTLCVAALCLGAIALRRGCPSSPAKSPARRTR